MASSGGSHSFEARLESLTGIVSRAQSEPGETVPTSNALLIADELLVSSRFAPKAQAYLNSKNVKFARLTTLLRNLRFPGGMTRPNDDVEVSRLLPPHPPVITLVEAMWAGPLKANKRAVTRNHLLIPASPWEDQCPFGPPAHSPTPWNHFHGPAGHGGAGITVIVNDQRLDALAGHANSVIGVLGQYTSYPSVSLWNHFGGFYPDTDEYTRELSVCRSLIRSHLQTQNQLINLGFAFTPLKDASKQDVLSIAWDLVFQVLGTDPTKLRVVTPAATRARRLRAIPVSTAT